MLGVMWSLTVVLDDVLVVEIAEKLDLALERAEHGFLPLLVRRRAGGQLDLLHGHEKTGGRVHAEVHLSERARTDERTLDPLDGLLAWKKHDSEHTVGRFAAVRNASYL